MHLQELVLGIKPKILIKNCKVSNFFPTLIQTAISRKAVKLINPKIELKSPELEEAFRRKWARDLLLSWLLGLKRGVNWDDREEEEEWAWHCKRLGVETLLRKEILELEEMQFLEAIGDSSHTGLQFASAPNIFLEFYCVIFWKSEFFLEKKKTNK